MRTLAIGDIHGTSTCLDALLDAVQPQPEDHLVFLGDYVDRGPDTKGVLDRLIALKQRQKATFLRGNHEIMMCESRQGKGEFRNWWSVGGSAALASYATRLGLAASLQDVPAAHWQFLERDLVNYLETEKQIFVHANLDGRLPLADQSADLLFWEFLKQAVGHDSGKLVICGHTSQRSGMPLDLGDTICIDTHAYAGGWLTCLDADSLEYWQADVLGRVRHDRLPPRTSGA